MIKLLITTALLLSAFRVNASDKVLITGAGATFPAPLYTKWLTEYNKSHPNIEINYQAIGSGGGIKQLLAKTVDFGASDAPMNDEELKSSDTPVVHIPTVMGAVVMIYNLPGLSKTVRLSGDVVADIFAGKITSWSDAKIAALNPGVQLPKQDLLVVYRSDSSGTTAVFTDYLTKVSEGWKSIGAGKSVKWPVGLGGKGNEGVAAAVKGTPGAIGYVELTYSKSSGMPMADLKNKSGNFVSASIKSVSDAAAGSLKSMPEDFRISITNADGKDSYPISSFTYLLIPQQLHGTKGQELSKFLTWAIADGQTFAPALSYAPLPNQMLKKVKAKVASIKVDAK